MEHTNKNPHSDDKQHETRMLAPTLYPEHGDGPYVNESVLSTIVVIETERQQELYPEVEVSEEDNLTDDEIDALVVSWVRAPWRRPAYLAHLARAVEDKQFFTLTAYAFVYIKNRLIFLLSGPAMVFYTSFCLGIVGYYVDAVDRYETFKRELGRGRATSLLGGFRAQLIHYIQTSYRRQGLRAFVLRTIDTGRFIVFFAPVQLYVFGIFKITQHKIQQVSLPQVSPQQKLVPVLLDSGNQQAMVSKGHISQLSYDEEEIFPPFLERGDMSLEFETPEQGTQKYTVQMIEDRKEVDKPKKVEKPEKNGKKPAKHLTPGKETTKESKKEEPDDYDGWYEDNKRGQNGEWHDDWGDEEEEKGRSEYIHTYIDDIDDEDENGDDAENEKGDESVTEGVGENGDSGAGENDGEDENGYQDDDEDEDDNGYDDDEEDDDENGYDENGYDEEDDDENGYDEEDDDENGYDDDDDDNENGDVDDDNEKVAEKENGDSDEDEDEPQSVYSVFYDVFPEEAPIQTGELETYMYEQEKAEASAEPDRVTRNLHPDEAWALVPATKSNSIRSYANKAGNKYEEDLSDSSLRDLDANWGALEEEFYDSQYPEEDTQDEEELLSLFGALEMLTQNVGGEEEEEVTKKEIKKRANATKSYLVNKRLSSPYECELEPGEEDEKEDQVGPIMVETEDGELVEYIKPPEFDMEGMLIQEGTPGAPSHSEESTLYEQYWPGNLGGYLRQKIAKRQAYYTGRDALFALADNMNSVQSPVEGWYGNSYYSGSVPGQWHERLELPLYAIDVHPSRVTDKEIEPQSHQFTVCSDAVVTDSFFAELLWDDTYQDGEDLLQDLDENGDEMGDETENGDGYEENDDETNVDLTDEENEWDRTESNLDSESIQTEIFAIDDNSAENDDTEELEGFKSRLKHYSPEFVEEDTEWYAEEEPLKVDVEDLTDVNKYLQGLETKVDLLARPIEVFSRSSSLDPVLCIWSTPTTVFFTCSSIIVYIELLYRLRTFGRQRRWENRERVFTKSIHLARHPKHVSLSELPGGYGKNSQLTRLLNAFEAKRGEQLYKPNIVVSWWENHIVPYFVYLSPKMQQWLLDEQAKARERRKVSGTKSTFKGLGPTVGVRLSTLQAEDEQPVDPRITLRQDINGWQAKALEQWWRTTHSHTDPNQNAPDWETKFIRCINTIGYSAPLMYVDRLTHLIAHEVRNFVPLSAIYPGDDRLEDLPKGLLLSGPAGNGRELFVRALAGDARLPLFVTESNRFSDDKWGLVRLMLAFRHARSYAPSILFLRELDMITYDREKNRNWRSLRMTTQLLLNMDGYNRSSNEYVSQRYTFVLGSVTTTRAMDSACLRSGRFEWVLEFRHPFPAERAKMLETFATFSQIETEEDMHWAGVSLATKGYSINDLRFVLNNAALQELYQGNKVCTRENVNHAIGLMNLLRDKSVVGMQREKHAQRRDFFAVQAKKERESPESNTSFSHLMINGVYVQKKVLQYLRLIIGQPEGATGLAANWARWATNPPETYWRDDSPDIQQQLLFMDGVVALVSEMVFLRDFEQASCSPMMVFDTYSRNLALQLQSVYIPVYERQRLARVLSTGTFIRQFNLWGKNQPERWTTLSYRPFRQLQERFYWLNKWYMVRRFRFKTSSLQFSIANHFASPSPSPTLESVHTTPLDIRNQYEDDATMSLMPLTIQMMLETRLRERNSVGFMNIPRRLHLREFHMFGTFATTHFFTQRDIKKVVPLKQVTTELLTLRQFTD